MHHWRYWEALVLAWANWARCGCLLSLCLFSRSISFLMSFPLGHSLHLMLVQLRIPVPSSIPRSVLRKPFLCFLLSLGSNSIGLSLSHNAVLCFSLYNVPRFGIETLQPVNVEPAGLYIVGNYVSQR